MLLQRRLFSALSLPCIVSIATCLRIKMWPRMTYNIQFIFSIWIEQFKYQLECGPMPVMAALPNIGGALCSTPQSLADAHYLTAVQ